MNLAINKFTDYLHDLEKFSKSLQKLTPGNLPGVMLYSFKAFFKFSVLRFVP